MPGLDEDEGLDLAEPVAAGDSQTDPITEILFEDAAFDDPHDVVGAARLSAGAAADHQGGGLGLDLLGAGDASAETNELVEGCESSHRWTSYDPSPLTSSRWLVQPRREQIWTMPPPRTMSGTMGAAQTEQSVAPASSA